MAKKLRIVLDTNIIISAIVFKGKLRQVYDFALNEKFKAVTSPVLISELTEVLTKKFSLSLMEVNLVEHEIKKVFAIVHPKKSIYIVRDIDDNRVLEAAVAGECSYIVTGDNDLLSLKSYEDISILTAETFLATTKLQ